MIELSTFGSLEFDNLKNKALKFYIDNKYKPKIVSIPSYTYKTLNKYILEVEKDEFDSMQSFILGICIIVDDRIPAYTMI